MDIFISYSRADAPFVARLQKELLAAKKQVWVDIEGILVAEEWWPRITAAITSADNFVLVLSPHSATSQVCLDEVRFALSTNKKIIPLLVESLPERPPDEIARVNWLVFPVEAEAFASGIRSLLDALNTDPHWVHQHTRILVRATDWHENPDTSRLLRGAELTDAEAWLASFTEGRVPAPTAKQISFIESSRTFAEEEVRRAARAKAVLEARRIAPLAAARMIRNEPGVAYQLAAISWEANPNELAQKVLFDFSNYPLQGEYRVEQAAEAIDIDPDGSRILLGWQRGIQSFELSDAQSYQLMTGAPVRTISYSPDGSMTLCVSGQNEQKLTLRRGSQWVWECKSNKKISAALFCKAGNKVLMGSWDGKAQIFDRHGKVLAILQHPDFVYDAQFSADGNHVVVACRDRCAYLWETSGKLVRKLEDETGHAAAFVGAGSNIVTSHRKGAAIWTASGRCLQALASRFPAKFVAGSPDGNFIATGQDMDQVSLWQNVAAEREGSSILGFGFRKPRGEQWVLKGQLRAPKWVSAVAFSPDNMVLMVTSGPNKLDADYKRRSGWSFVRLWGSDGELITELTHPYSVECVRFSPHGEHVLTASGDGAGRLWRVKTRPISVITSEHPFSADFLPDDSGIVTDEAKQIRVFDLNGKLLSSLKPQFPISQLTVHEEGKLILSGGHDGAARLFGLNGDLKAEFRPNVRHSMTGDVDAMFSPGGALVVTLQYNTVTLWTLDGNHHLDLVHDTGGAMTSVRFSEDGRFFLTAGLDKGGARLWGIDGQLRAKFPDEDYYVTVAEFWPNGGQILTCGKAPKLWSPSGELVRTFAMPDARQIIVLSHAMVWVAEQSTTAGLWNLEGELIAQLEHDDYVRQAAVSPDGYRVLTVAGNRASLWDLAGNLLTFVDHTYEIRSARFSATGDYCLLMATGSAMLWDCFSPKRIIDYYKAKIPALSAAERRSFLGADESR